MENLDEASGKSQDRWYGGDGDEGDKRVQALKSNPSDIGFI
jgi:hypothetical protein